MTADESRRGRRYKVARLAEEYGLDGIGEELERRWTADPPERASLRELADDVNRRILAAALAAVGTAVLEGEVENLYRLLTAETVSEGVRTEAERRLRREGIDVDGLRADFVTYQAVRTYLTKGRGVAYEATREDPVESASERIERVLGRTEAVAEDALDHLERTDRVVLGEFRVSGRIRVTCTGCGAHLDVAELLDRGGCDCTSERS